MGRTELYGMFLYKPDKLDKETKIKIKKLEWAYRKFLREKNIEKRIDDGDKTLMSLLPDSYWNRVIDADGLSTQEIIEDIPTMINFLETLDWEQLKDGNTVNSTIKVFDNVIQVYFSGESSYGDEPETQGYTFIKDTVKSGLWDILYESCFPQSQSIHFIKNLNKLKE